MKIVIHGSCVTRDAFEFEHPLAIKKSEITYFARSSLITKNNPPFFIEENEIQNISLFQKRCVLSDLTNSFYKYISENDLSEAFLIIDFIDERNKIIKYRNHYFTQSEEFINSNLSKILTGTTLERESPDTIKLWKENCLLFIEKIKQVFKPGHVVLHKALGKEKYYHGIEILPFSFINRIRINNGLLEEYYGFFESHFPGISVIDLNNKGYLSDKDHKWGLSPFHYVSDYYFDFMDSLERIMKENTY